MKNQGGHLLERVTGCPTLFTSHFLNFLSALGGVFQNFRPLWVPFLSFIHSRSQFFHLSAPGLSKWGIVSALGCQK